jgi:hypothetical protein
VVVVGIVGDVDDVGDVGDVDGFFLYPCLPLLSLSCPPQHRHRSRRSRARKLTVAMSNWMRSNLNRSMLCCLVEAGQLPPLTNAMEWKVPGEESVPRPPRGYVISFVAFHKRGFSVPSGRFIRAVLYEYGLQLQHLNPNSIQQMATFEALCEGYLGISAHWHLFKYFFMFVCVKDNSKEATIGYANLRMKQGWGDRYIPSSLTSSNSD